MMNDKDWITLIGKFAFHLYDTHGFPKEEFIRKVVDKDGYFMLPTILTWINMHKDFRKEINWKLKK